ncbi:transglycosylase SLT domain-containing protein [Pseudomonas chlororaphis subsp. aurantiaca]|uniref:lytic transglycosylase domain-containing protein n=1 Tax=Pseudomonas chlororaphis TaxID=587753 RepID=UPI0027DE57C4|nr:transglycosylase SLT domain-containing protein [Pseudomonas chlororaphis]WMI97590.1 transglycosylase SLT domain-containing protein [Pseudomonas chlororaphis subsp. aurantiaca]
MSTNTISQHPNPAAGASKDVAVVRQARLEAAAEQFEAMFLQQILKQMRKAGDVLSEGSSLRSHQSDTLREMHDEALAENLATQRKTGIADMLVKQLSHGDVPVGGPTDAVHAARYDLPPASPAPPRADSLFAPIVTTWQRGIDSLSRGAAGLKALVERVIEYESGGQGSAVSGKGARGVMQLMPGTAREMADELNLEYSEHRLTTDDAYNKRLGVAYLNKLIKRYDGATALAVAAYNAGPGRVDEWLKVNGDPRQGQISVGQWVERIPFKETRLYTRNILADLNRPTAPVSAHLPVAPGAGLEMASIGFKSMADSVAMKQGVLTSTVSRTCALSSPAFAPNMRLVRKEIES